MKSIKNYILLICVALAFASCNKNEQTTPSYLSIDAVVLDRGNDDQWNHKDKGFFTHLVDAVSITYWVKGDDKWTTLGTFQLPCRVPVLREGVIDTFQIEPVVKQNGISATRIYYPYFKTIGIGKTSLVPDQTVSFDTLHTTYKSSKTVSVPWEEYFTPTSTMRLDTCVSLCMNSDTVCTGNGCGVIRVSKDQRVVNFWSDTTFAVLNPSAYVYLEMDYWTDFDLSVGMKNPTHQGGALVVENAMTLYPNKGWQKIYINLGKLWAWYNNYPYIRLYFSILNGEGREGNVYLDNMKVVVM